MARKSCSRNRGIPNRVVENRFLRPGKPGDYRLRRRLRDRMRRLSDRDLAPEAHKSRACAVGIGHFEEPELRTPLSEIGTSLRRSATRESPALSRQTSGMPNVLRQNLAFETRSLPVVQ